MYTLYYLQSTSASCRCTGCVMYILRLQVPIHTKKQDPQWTWMVTFTAKRTEAGTMLSVSGLQVTYPHHLARHLLFQEISLFKIGFILVSTPLIFIENYVIPSINATHFAHLQMLKYFFGA